LPLRIQQVGGFNTNEAAFWAGLATSGLGIVMFFISPVWGAVADRFGRKLMVLRAMFGGALVISLIGLATSVYLIVGLRWLQGMLTGSVAAASALVATMAPRERLPFSIGMIMVAIFTGSSLGPLLGGIVADNLGYQATFFFSGGMLLVSGVCVLTLIKEEFRRPAEGKGITLRGMLNLARSREMLPLLIAMALLNFGPSMVGPLISLRVKELDPMGQAATASGLTFSLMGATAAVSSFASGRLSGRVKLSTIMVFSCVMAGVLYLPPVWAGTVGALTVLLAIGGLVRGGISTTSNAMVGLAVPPGQEGIA
jgi:DHA1 family multidrug resistance protein-like MFS transporter